MFTRASRRASWATESTPCKYCFNYQSLSTLNRAKVVNDEHDGQYRNNNNTHPECSMLGWGCKEQYAKWIVLNCVWVCQQNKKNNKGFKLILLSRIAQLSIDHKHSKKKHSDASELLFYLHRWTDWCRREHLEWRQSVRHRCCGWWCHRFHATSEKKKISESRKISQKSWHQQQTSSRETTTQ